MTIKELEENLQEGIATAASSSKKNLAHAKVVGTSCDVCDPNDVKNLANFAVNELGSIDIWVSKFDFIYIQASRNWYLNLLTYITFLIPDSIVLQINNAGTNKGFRPLLEFTDEDIQQVCAWLLAYAISFPEVFTLE